MLKDIRKIIANGNILLNAKFLLELRCETLAPLQVSYVEWEDLNSCQKAASTCVTLTTFYPSVWHTCKAVLQHGLNIINKILLSLKVFRFTVVIFSSLELWLVVKF